jgi:histidinol-phosphate/aromatic aminotransferase/cobyric acid decarboxylase-like protein
LGGFGSNIFDLQAKIVPKLRSNGLWLLWGIESCSTLNRCTLDPGDKIVDCPPTFTMYAFDAAVNGASVVKGTYSVSDFKV